MIETYIGDPFAAEKITVGATATGLTRTIYETVATKARAAVITYDNTTDFRYSVVKGATPTATDGHFVDVDVERRPIVLRTFTEIENFLASGQGAVLYVTYFA